MRRLISIVFAIMFLPSMTLANEASSAAKIVQNAKQECNGIDNGEFHSTEKAITSYDITGDGQMEAVVDAAQFSCSTALTLWGGSGGTYLWVVAPDKTYEFLAHRWRMIDFDGQSVLLLAVHSAQCSDLTGRCVS